MISVNCISKYYGENCIIKDWTYSFPDNGFYLLLGESGSGKTTLINILFGLIPFENGKIIINGKEYTNKVDLLDVSGIAEYITQDAFFVEYLSMYDNLKMVSDNDELIITYVERFYLGELLKQRPASLSGGEKQRFAIVRALLQKKKILFLDEPTAALDETNKREVFSLLKELKSEILILCATHDRIASQYADSVIHFNKWNVSKNEKTEIKQNGSVKEGKTKKQKSESRKNSNVIPWLLKWFKYKRQRERLILIFFLIVAFCLIIFSDTTERKINTTKNQLYNLNVLPVTITNHKRWDDLGLPKEGIRQVVLNYSWSCPDGNETVDLDNDMGILPQYEYENVLTIPFSADEFKLSDRIIYGTYFTSSDQMILTYEMAYLLNPSDMKSLIGKKLTKDFYGLGKVDLEIVGILGKLSENEKAYMDQYTDNRDWYSDYYFVNSELTGKLEYDDSFYYITRINGRRVYDLYFDSYSDLMKYYQKYQPSIGSSDDYFFTPASGITEVKIRILLDMLFPILLPLSILLAVMAIIYYVQIRKMEYNHKHQFISVFEYTGYSKKKVINSFILLNNIELVICMAIAFVISLSITVFSNLINRAACLVPMVIFTYNPAILLSFFFGIILIGSLTTWIQYHKVSVMSWYEDLIDTRDLI